LAGQLGFKLAAGVLAISLAGLVGRGADTGLMHLPDDPGLAERKTG